MTSSVSLTFSPQIITTITKKFVSLTIRHVESIDCGVYTCKVKNSVSDISIDFTLSMKGKTPSLRLPHRLPRQALPPARPSPGHLEDRGHPQPRLGHSGV